MTGPDRNLAINSASEALLTASQQPNQGRSSGQLGHAAKEFESVLLSQWLQEAESGFAAVPGSEDDQDAGTEQMKSYAVQALAKAFTDAGGLGIAALVNTALTDKTQTSSEQQLFAGKALDDVRVITSTKP